MRKLFLFLFYSFFMIILSYGQTNFGSEQIITNSAEGAASVCTADIDGDGDQDVISASELDYRVVWYENTDGNGSFITNQILTSTGLMPTSVYAADIDSDGDQDVISAYNMDGEIVWFENTDGNGSFSQEQVIVTSETGLTCIQTADIDGDGDQDVLSSVVISGVAWYENTDGAGNFGSKQLIGPIKSWAVLASDLDSDGDKDVLCASHTDNKIYWYENSDGNGDFVLGQDITSSAVGAVSLYAADFDNDDDNDILAASAQDSKIIWFENNDGQGWFVEKQVISSSVDVAKSVYAADIDLDGDEDVISASIEDDKIAWYENTDGNGTFGQQHVISTLADSAWCVYAADIDGDGDNDVLSASYNDNKIAWYENQTLSFVVSRTKQAKFDISPNPTNGVLSLNFSDFEKFENIKYISVFDIAGKKIIEKKNVNRNEKLNLSEFEKGIYIIKLKVGEEIFSKKLIKNR